MRSSLTVWPAATTNGTIWLTVTSGTLILIWLIIRGEAPLLVTSTYCFVSGKAGRTRGLIRVLPPLSTTVPNCTLELLEPEVVTAICGGAAAAADGTATVECAPLAVACSGGIVAAAPLEVVVVAAPPEAVAVELPGKDAVTGLIGIVIVVEVLGTVAAAGGVADAMGAAMTVIVGF